MYFNSFVCEFILKLSVLCVSGGLVWVCLFPVLFWNHLSLMSLSGFVSCFILINPNVFHPFVHSHLISILSSSDRLSSMLCALYACNPACFFLFHPCLYRIVCFLFIGGFWTLTFPFWITSVFVDSPVLFGLISLWMYQHIKFKFFSLGFL